MRAVMVGLLLALLSTTVDAQTLRMKRVPSVLAPTLTQIPPEARTRQAALLARATPEQRSFIARTAPTATDEATVRAQVITAFPALSSGDIEAVALLVLMAAADDADADLRNNMSEMKSLRMQAALDRRSKAMSALSNILRKTSETTDGIIRNIK
jgi:hypothetical protein